MAARRFDKSFTQQEPIPDTAIQAAVDVMRTGRLHRYNTAPGEVSQSAALEGEFAQSMGAAHALAVASGGYALQLSLRAAGVGVGDKVLTNAFTLSPVPGAIVAVGAVPVLVETTADLTIDLADLAPKMGESGAGVLMLSHMRGHIADMDALMALADCGGVRVIEDCAHTMGATWGGRPSGTFGIAGCFSCQTYKHINSGEGGLLTTDDDALMARAIVLSGSYMFTDRHGAALDPDAFEGIDRATPNMSGRMDELRAAILRPQLAALDESVARWNARYKAMADALHGTPGLILPHRAAAEGYVGSSIQFRCPDLDAAGAAALIAACRERGVELKWFGAAAPAGYTSRHDHWHYLPAQDLPQTDKILSRLFDMRLPLTFTVDDCRLIGEIICEAFAHVRSPETVGVA